MSRKVRSVRVPAELDSIDLTGMIREFEKYLRDIESASMLKAKGNKKAAEALLKTRHYDLGRKIGRMIWESRLEHRRRQEG